MPIDPNNFTQLNVGEQGSIMDETAVDYGDFAPITNPYPLASGAPVYRRRSRIVLAGQGVYDICNVSNDSLIGNEYGVAVRPIVRTYANPINEFGDSTGTSQNSPTTVVSYTVPSSNVFSFMGCKVSGDLGAKFTVYVDAAEVYTLRTTNANLDGMIYFNTPVFEVPASSVVLIQVIYYNNNNSITCDFEGTIIGFNTPI
jgi:hypothetical protein